ncbi:CDP-glycerol glycerophosphotransferase family protein [Leucobacter sp. USHLN153]|uniref:CDP-glycerol glycerophosphotransferase family protein n=1 Tax=Leucobacter sp. USHLN153 TaxID=3081268 RepID=UPI00301B1A50
MNSLIEGQLVSRIIGAPFRACEILFRGVQLGVRGVRLLLQRKLAAKGDALLARIGKRWLAQRSEINDRSIVMMTMQGEYTCNPKYIAEEILRRRLPWEITWVLRDWSIGPFPEEFKFVPYGTARYFEALASAKVVVQNGHTLQVSGAEKGSGQYWLQTWHGSLGLKKLEGAGGDRKYYEGMRRLENAQTDLAVTNSTFEDSVFSSTYWPDVEKARLGHARNDVLFDRAPDQVATLRKKVLDRLGIRDRGQKFLLCAPTHDDGRGSDPLNGINVATLRGAMARKFSGEWDVLIRTHHRDKLESEAVLAGLPAYCYNASLYPDMQELLVVADAGLSDYSSWVCDYINTRKPAFLFSTDIETYSRQRGFYHDFADTPFTMATSNEGLLKNIEEFDQGVYGTKIESFLQRCGSIDDGLAAVRIVDRIEELMQR